MQTLTEEFKPVALKNCEFENRQNNDIERFHPKKQKLRLFNLRAV